MEARSAPPPTDARPPCGLTRGEFAQFLEKALMNPNVPLLFDTYFFTTSPPRHLSHLCINDDLVRCFKCGCTIDEHNIGSPPIQVPRQPRQNPHESQGEHAQGSPPIRLPDSVGDKGRLKPRQNPPGFIDMYAKVGSIPTVKSEVKDEVYVVFAQECMLTHETKDLKVSHIIPKSMFRDKEACEFLRWSLADFNSPCNLLLLCEDAETAFDNLLWCFVPFSQPCDAERCSKCKYPGHLASTCTSPDGVTYEAFAVREMITGSLELRQRGVSLSGTVVYVPSTVARTALYLHAFYAHTRYNIAMPAVDGYKRQNPPNTGSPPQYVVDYVNEMVRMLRETNN